MLEYSFLPIREISGAMVMLKADADGGKLFAHAEASAGGRVIPEWWRIAKRATDITIGISALLLSSPVIAIATVAIIVSTKGPPFFSQQRVGKNGREFKMFKLRTMVQGAHLLQNELRAKSDVTGPVFKMKDDPRCFPVGRVLRRMSIDELPNFVNVILGDMSVVGPRPPLRSEVEHYDSYARRRLEVKPGITCLWQISGRSSINFDDWMDLDHKYIDTWTPLGDLAIIAATIPAVLCARGAH